MVRRVAFLDRDGVINIDKAYVYRWEDFEYIPRSIDALKYLNDRNIGIVVVTNQAGIARGYYSEEQYMQLTTRYLASLSDNGVSVMGVYHCPHHPDGVVSDLAFRCNCRKPQPGMLIRAATELNIDVSKAFLVGDKMTDIQSAHAAGISEAYLIGENRSGIVSISTGNFRCFENLWDCVSSLSIE